MLYDSGKDHMMYVKDDPGNEIKMACVSRYPVGP
jgi:hypothetical protein